MEIAQVLEKIGLEEKESKVYLALLELGTADVSDIAKKAGIKRPTCYLVLDDLKNKGLVSQVPAKVNLFTAESPEKLQGEMYKKMELYKRFLPNMLALFNAKKEKPKVQLFEGKEGIKLIYEKIYKANEVWFFGTTKEAQKYDPEGLNEFIQRTGRESVVVRDLLTQNPEDLEYANKVKSGKNYQTRFIKSGHNFLSDNAGFGDNIVFFSFHPQIFAVMITSREISLAIKTLFEFSWQAAKPYEKIMNQDSG